MIGLYGIVGGPCTGKSTTIGVFRARGYRILEETATLIIGEQKETGGVVVPWDDFESFQRAVFHISLAKEIIVLANIHAGKYDGPVFSDRLSIGDAIGYHDEKGHPTYETDSIRWEDDEKARKLHTCLDAAHRRVAEAMGVPLVDVPYIARATSGEGAAARADFILERIAAG
ncbi:MAG: AAA family ATPase, partial [Nanoarchaeota archaeon]